MSLPMPALLKPAPFRRRLWQGGLAIALFVLTLGVANCFVGAEKSVNSSMLGHDFMAFYTAASFVEHGHADRLYDINATAAYEAELGKANGLEVGKGFGPYWNPPFYAMLFSPIAKLPYRQALAVWVLIHVAALAVAMKVLAGLMLAPEEKSWFAADASEAKVYDWKTLWLVPLILLVSMPFIQAISHGQNTFVSLMLLSATAALWRRQRALVAGLICGMLFYKPQLAAIVAVMLTLTVGYRALIGVTISGTIFLGFQESQSAGSTFNWLLQLPQNVRFMQIENAYLWERHATLKAFWRLLIQGREAGEMWKVTSVLYYASIACVVAGLARVLLRNRKASTDDVWTGDTASLRRDRIIAATITATPLLMPFYFDYDLLLLAVPAVLLAGELLHRPSGAKLVRSDRWLLTSWVALFFWLMVNPGLAKWTGVNGTVVLLSAVSGLTIARAARRESAIETESEKFLPIHRDYRAAA